MWALRSFAFKLTWGVWTALFGLAIPVLLAFGSPAAAIRSLTRIWARGFLALLSAWLGIIYVVTGQENVPRTPCLIVSNHQSVWETVAALLLFPDLAIVAKRELLKIPVLGWYLKRSPMIIIDRDLGVQAVRRMTDQSRAALQEGRSVLIFPEGTRNAPGEPIRFRRGIEFLYRNSRVPVLPVVVNSGRFWGGRGKLRGPGTITVSILPALDADLSPSVLATVAEEMMEKRRTMIGG